MDCRTWCVVESACPNIFTVTIRLFVPGFGGIGRPHDIHTDMSDRSPLLRQLACGRFNLSTQTPAPTECFLCQNGSISKGCGLRKLRASCRNTTKPALCAILNVQSQLRSTVYFAKNTWAFVCGDLDQAALFRSNPLCAFLHELPHSSRTNLGHYMSTPCGDYSVRGCSGNSFTFSEVRVHGAAP